LACGIFLERNGCILVASNVDAYHAISALAAGDIGERKVCGVDAPKLENSRLNALAEFRSI
jgi:hypothetical protein